MIFVSNTNLASLYEMNEKIHFKLSSLYKLKCVTFYMENTLNPENIKDYCLSK